MGEEVNVLMIPSDHPKVLPEIDKNGVLVQTRLAVTISMNSVIPTSTAWFHCLEVTS